MVVRSDNNVNSTKVTISQVQVFISPICFLVSLSSCNVFLQLSVGQSADDLVTFIIVSDLTSEDSSSTLTSSELVMQY